MLRLVQSHSTIANHNLAKRALQATTMAAIDVAALDKDLLSRGISNCGSIAAHARRYKELKGKDVTWPLPA